MQLNLENFNIRSTNPYLAGPIGLAPGEERYIVKAQGLIGIEIFKGDILSINNIEGKQECEIVTFDNEGKNNLGIIGQKQNSEAKFIKLILSNSSDYKFLISKLKKRKIDFYNTKSFNFFDSETAAGATERINSARKWIYNYCFTWKNNAC